MVQIDVPAAFVASMFFLDVGKKMVKREAAKAAGERPAAYYRFLFRSLLYAAVVIAPAGLYLLAGWPGWEQLYWSERVENTTFNWVNALIPAAFVAAIVLAGYAGHVLAYRWLTTGREKLIRPTYLGVLVVVTAAVLLNYPAFLLVGTYREYHFARAAMGFVWENPHGFTTGWAIIISYFLVATLYVYFKIRKEGKAVDET